MKRTSTLLAVGGGALLLVACDLPTEAPILEQRWVIEIEGTALGVSELLPAGVTSTGSAFDVTVDDATTNETLENMCSACIPLNGTIAPVPAFGDTFDVDQPMPANVNGGTIQTASMDLTIDNGLSFDPLENGGTIIVRVSDGAGGPSLGSVGWDGGDGESIPGGTSDTKTLALPQSTVGSTLVITTQVVAPGGQISNIDITEILTVTADPTEFLVASASVNIVNEPVTFGPEPLSTEEIDASVTERIIEGSIILAVGNPFGIALDGSLDLGGTSQAMNIGPGATSTVTIGYTGDELRQILGQPGVGFGGSGSANAVGAVLLTPDLELSMTPTIDFTICVGGQPTDCQGG